MQIVVNNGQAETAIVLDVTLEQCAQVVVCAVPCDAGTGAGLEAPRPGQCLVDLVHLPLRVASEGRVHEAESGENCNQDDEPL